MTHSRWTIWIWWWLAFGVSLVALGYHARDYVGFFIDDSFISLRYSERLLRGLGLTWTDGERVEGYSNFLWVVLVAGLGVFIDDLVRAAQTLGALTSAAAIAAIVLAAFRGARSLGAAVSGLYAGLAFAASGPLAAWTLGGLEQPLLVGLLCWAYVLAGSSIERDASVRDVPLLAASGSLGAACLVRPDGFLFALAAAFGGVLAGGVSRRSWQRAAVLLMGPIAFVACHATFRKIYYDAWVPNTYHAKGAFSWERVNAGWSYVRETLPTLGALYGVIGVALLWAAFDTQARRRMAIPLVACVGWTAYVVRIGGDICPQHRHLTVTLALACLLLAQLGGLAWERGSWLGRGAALLVGPMVLAGLILGQRGDPARARALSDNWHWSGRPVGTMLAAAFSSQRPLLAVDAAGALPFYYRLPCLDMLGLNDRYLALHPPADIGRGYTGHELGDGRYVLSRKPDLIAFWTPIGGDKPQWRSGHEMVGDPSFRKLYQAVTFQADARTRARLWVRRLDGPIGMRVTPQAVTVPAYLLDAGRETPVVLDRRRRLTLTLAPRQSARVRDVPLAPGTWKFSMQGLGAAVVTLHGAGAPLTLSPGTTFVWQKPGNGRAQVRVSAGDEPVTVESLGFLRQTPSH